MTRSATIGIVLASLLALGSCDISPIGGIVNRTFFADFVDPDTQAVVGYRSLLLYRGGSFYLDAWVDDEVGNGQPALRASGTWQVEEDRLTFTPESASFQAIFLRLRDGEVEPEAISYTTEQVSADELSALTYRYEHTDSGVLRLTQIGDERYGPRPERYDAQHIIDALYSWRLYYYDTAATLGDGMDPLLLTRGEETLVLYD